MRIFFLLACLCVSSSFAFGSTVVIIDRAKERKSTRWTLTEWLRIKERMKLMDTWRAMFSEPQKEKFRPELILSYKRLELYQEIADAESSYKGTADFMSLKGDLWLTNLISSSTGIRTLNIDLGVGSIYESGETIHTLANNQFSSQENYLHNNRVLFRIFGKSIQDSNITLEAGEYSLRHPFLSEAALSSAVFKGKSAGARLELYLNSWLGLNFSYRKLEEAKSVINSKAYFHSGTDLKYGAFIEVSVIRLEMGLVKNESKITDKATESITATNEGQYTGITLSF